MSAATGHRSLSDSENYHTLLRKGWDPIIIADRMAMGLVRARHVLVLSMARAARRLADGKDWFTFGYARLEDHARERFGRSGRWVRDLARLAEAVNACPALATALTGEDGGRAIGTVAAMLVGRVATRETSADWIAAARRLTVRQLRNYIREAQEAGSTASAGSAASAVSAGSAAWPDPAGSTASAGSAALPDSARSTARAASVSTVTTAASDLMSAGSGDTSICDDAPSLSRASQADVVSLRPPDAAYEPAHEVDEERSWEQLSLRFAVPAAIVSIVEEARDLHRAVCGGETTAAEFIEALLAEASAGPESPLVNESWIGARPSLGTREAACERQTDRWAFLHDRRLDGEDLCTAAETLKEVERLCREADASTGSADGTIRSLVRMENDIERDLGDLLARMGECGAWKGMRFSGIGHYAEERLGISRSQAQSRAHLSRLLRDRPLVREALEDGRLGWEAASLVIRAAPRAWAPEHLETTVSPGGTNATATELAWIHRAAQATIKRLRDELCAVERDRALHPDTAVSLPLDDRAWHESRSRRHGESTIRIAELTRAACASPSPSSVIRFWLPVDLASQLRSTVYSERKRLESIVRDLEGFDLAGGHRLEGASATPGPASKSPVSAVSQPSSAAGCTRVEDLPGSVRAAQMFSRHFCGVPDWIALLSLIEGFVGVWDDPRLSPKRAADRIYIRDGWRCSAPGCTSRRNLEDHHVLYRSRGGSHALSNRVTLCRFHHQQGEHGDLMKCRGRAPLGLTWLMGRRGIGGSYRNERRI